MSEIPLILSNRTGIGNTVLSRYVSSDEDYSFDGAANAFRNEALAALVLLPSDSYFSKRRKELLRPFIIKIFLYIGAIPGDRTYGLLARTLESFVVRPTEDYNKRFDYLAEKAGMTRAALLYRIEKNFDMRDADVAERISFITRTKPQTAMDAFFDVINYVRVIFYGGAFGNE